MNISNDDQYDMNHSELIFPPIRNNVCWVQCERPACGKWRKINNQVEYLPDAWYCDMNEDLDYNDCSKNEEQNPNQIPNLLDVQFTVGALVWARMAGHPWWPAMVTTDPDYQVHYIFDKNKLAVARYHVLFFGDVLSRGWVPATSVKAASKWNPQAMTRSEADSSVIKTQLLWRKKDMAMARQQLEKAAVIADPKERIETFSVNWQKQDRLLEVKAEKEKIDRGPLRGRASNKQQGEKLPTDKSNKTKTTKQGHHSKKDRMAEHIDGAIDTVLTSGGNLFFTNKFPEDSIDEALRSLTEPESKHKKSSKGNVNAQRERSKARASIAKLLDDIVKQVDRDVDTDESVAREHKSQGRIKAKPVKPATKRENARAPLKHHQETNCKLNQSVEKAPKMDLKHLEVKGNQNSTSSSFQDSNQELESPQKVDANLNLMKFPGMDSCDEQLGSQIGKADQDSQEDKQEENVAEKVRKMVGDLENLVPTSIGKAPKSKPVFKPTFAAPKEP